nr:hypothetical protein [Tanacetum cinerariifolium]
MSVARPRWQPARDDGEVVWLSGEDCDNGSVVGGWNGTGGDDGDGLEKVSGKTEKLSGMSLYIKLLQSPSCDNVI